MKTLKQAQAEYDAVMNNPNTTDLAKRVKMTPEEVLIFEKGLQEMVDNLNKNVLADDNEKKKD